MNVHLKTFLISLALSTAFFGCYAMGTKDIGADEEYFSDAPTVDLPCDRKLLPSEHMVLETRPFQENELAATHQLGSIQIRESLCGVKMANNSRME